VIEKFLSSNPYAAATKRTYTDILTRFLSDIPYPQSVSAAQLVYYLEHTTGWGNARQCMALSCIRAYLAWAYGQTHPALSARIKQIKGKMPRTISQETARILLASFNPHTAKGSRDLAIAALLLDTGLRESEICRLTQADTDTDRRILQVLVKGGRWEWAIFTEETAAHIEHWKLFRQRLNPHGELFTHSQTGKAITPEGLYNIVSVWGKTIGVTLSPHDFRRGFATISSENGAPDRAIMEGGRWLSLSMVVKYTRAFRLEAMRPWLPMKKLSENV
jgi:integrase